MNSQILPDLDSKTKRPPRNKSPKNLKTHVTSETLTKDTSAPMSSLTGMEEGNKNCSMEVESFDFCYPSVKKRFRPVSPKNSTAIKTSNSFSALEDSPAVKKKAVEKELHTKKNTSSTTGSQPRIIRSMSSDGITKADVPAHKEGLKKDPESETSHRSNQGSGSGGLRKKALSKDNIFKPKDRSPQSKDKAGKNASWSV